ncbi:MAG: Glu/Leu/Phe/Val dehydrogenase, partial [Deltaproteobacteria bacterium]|nr:Glu/Leu/Phe/Val dehydrogenase [Deltaproteobacteria bacterium]
MKEVDLFHFADDLGPEKILHLYDPQSRLKAIVVVDNVALGQSIGGVRMAPDVSVEEAFRLARAMTLKNSSAGLDHGGGKAVIYGNPLMPPGEKRRLIQAFARGIRDLKDYVPGPDMGTNEQCMGWMHDEIGRAIGLPRERGGIPLDEIGATGWGLLQAVEVGSEFAGFSLKGARVVVQGFGAVGGHAARFLSGKGAVLVGVASLEGALYSPDGLDVERLIELRDAGRSLGDYGGLELKPPLAVLEFPCDIWIPAARPDV